MDSGQDTAPKRQINCVLSATTHAHFVLKFKSIKKSTIINIKTKFSEDNRAQKIVMVKNDGFILFAGNQERATL